MVPRIARFYRSAYAGLPREVWILCLVALVNRSGMMVLPFLTLYLRQELDFSMLRAGYLLALYGVGAMVGVQIGGWLTDRLGTLRVQVGSLLAAGPLFLVLGSLDTFLGLAGALFALSLVTEAFRPASQAALGNHCPALLRPRAFGLYRVAINVGVTIGPVAGGVLAVRDFSLLFAVNAVAVFVSGVLLLALGRGWVPLDEAGPKDAAPQRGSSPWRDGPMLLAAFLAMLVGIAFLQTQTTFMVYLGELRGFGADRIGLLLAINTVMVVVLEMPLLARLPAQSNLRWVARGALLTGLGFGLMPYGEATAFVALTIAVWTMGEILSMPMLSVFVAGRSGVANRGRYMGLFSLAFAAATVIAPLAGTAVWERFGPDAVWHGCLLLGILAALGFLFLERLVSPSPAEAGPAHAR